MFFDKSRVDSSRSVQLSGENKLKTPDKMRFKLNKNGDTFWNGSRTPNTQTRTFGLL